MSYLECTGAQDIGGRVVLLSSVVADGAKVRLAILSIVVVVVLVSSSARSRPWLAVTGLLISVSLL